MAIFNNYVELPEGNNNDQTVNNHQRTGILFGQKIEFHQQTRWESKQKDFGNQPTQGFCPARWTPRKGVKSNKHLPVLSYLIRNSFFFTAQVGQNKNVQMGE